ncbi:MAG TPA: hypothetical protein VFN68_00735 [Acidimicrobiales bacterium]|nr:hypothetical protein [Acidimicrobiales bacterium]
MTTATAAPPPGGGAGGAGRPDRWLAAGPGLQWLGCRGFHLRASGALDERARRLSHEELAVAEMFAAEGHLVRSLPESRRGGRRPDLEVCGSPVEVKSYLRLGERAGPPTAESVFNKLMDAAGQADAAVLYGRGSGLSPATVRGGLARLAVEGRDRRLRVVRAVGDGFDLAWIRRPGLVRAMEGGARRPGPRRPDLGL